MLSCDALSIEKISLVRLLTEPGRKLEAAEEAERRTGARGGIALASLHGGEERLAAEPWMAPKKARSRRSRDDESARRLWELSERLTGVAWA